MGEELQTEMTFLVTFIFVLSLSGAISTQRGVMIARCGACSIIFHSPIR